MLAPPKNKGSSEVGRQEGPKKAHEQKDPTNHAFCNPLVFSLRLPISELLQCLSWFRCVPGWSFLIFRYGPTEVHICQLHVHADRDAGLLLRNLNQGTIVQIPSYLLCM